MSYFKEKKLYKKMKLRNWKNGFTKFEKWIFGNKNIFRAELEKRIWTKFEKWKFEIEKMEFRNLKKQNLKKSIPAAYKKSVF